MRCCCANCGFVVAAAWKAWLATLTDASLIAAGDSRLMSCRTGPHVTHAMDTGFAAQEHGIPWSVRIAAHHARSKDDTQIYITRVEEFA